MTDASTALAELKEISSQVESAVLFDDTGKVVAATIPDERAAKVAASAQALLEQAGHIGGGELTQLEASTGDGSLFVVKDGPRLIAASTSAEPTAGLVFYDLKRCLQASAKTVAKPKPKAAAKPKPKAAAKPKPKPRTTRSKSDGPS
jgi:predicted regulator of Ras-like GTPase activity (Roadblock/LC7/MglB family)